MRRKTRKVRVGNVFIGGDTPISIQSMTNTSTSDIDATVRQIQALTDEGCDIVRVAVPDLEAADAISKIKERIAIPLVADIHFDYRLALKAMENGPIKSGLIPGTLALLSA